MSEKNQLTRLRWCVFLSIFIYNLILFFFMRTYSFFLGDDYDHFIQAATLPLHQMMFTAIDVHFVPLYKLMNAIVFALSPLNFDVALGLLMLFHVLSVYLLYKLLQELMDTPWNLLLVFLYASNIFLIHQLMWWSSGLLRLPYIFLSLGCLFCYVRYRKTRHLGYVLCSFAAFVMAFGFYSKAILIPLYVLGLELCLSWRQGFRQLISRFWPGSVMLLLSMGYLLWYVKFAPVMRGGPLLSLSLTFEIILMNFKVMACTFALALSYPPNFLVYWSFSLLVAGLMLFTFIKARETMLMWAVLFTLMILNFAIIAYSSRGQMFGVLIALGLRYYFELMFLVVLYVALIVRAIRGNATAQTTALYPRRYWMVFLLCLVYSVGSFWVGGKDFHKVYSNSFVATAHYMHALMDDIEQLPKDSPLLFTQANLPLYVYGGMFKVYMPMERILPLRYEKITFVPRSQATYEVDKDGHVLNIKKSD